LIPIKLNTTYGQEQYNILSDQFNFYHKEQEVSEFNDRCKQDHEIQLKYLEYFLNDDKLSSKFKLNEEDEVGFKIFNMQHDICSVLCHFSTKRT